MKKIPGIKRLLRLNSSDLPSATSGILFIHNCTGLCLSIFVHVFQVVKEFEKPAKVVKARASLKRKLLQGSDPAPPMVDVFGSWQVEDYKPPVAQNGVVPRNIHGTIDLFKPCMLPIGCAHLCLTGKNTPNFFEFPITNFTQHLLCALVGLSHFERLLQSP